MPLEFLTSPCGEAAAAAPEVVIEPAAEPAPAQASEPAPATEGNTQDRGPDGKFLPKAGAQPAPVVAEVPPSPAPAPAPAAEPQAPAIAPEAAPAGPTLEDRIAELERANKGLTTALTASRQQRRQVEPAPDPSEDWEGYQQHQENDRAMERADWSRKLAEARTDPETVAKAHEWASARADADPIFAHRAWNSPDPYGFALEEYQRDQALVLLSDPKLLQQFRDFQAGHGPALAQPVPAPAPAVAAPAPPPAPEPPPPSLASAPSAGGPASTPVGPGQAFDRTFTRR